MPAVALKVLHKRRLSERQLRRAQHEASVHRSFNHPNVCRFFETITTPRMMCLVLELCDTSLDQHLHTCAPLPLGDVARIAVDTARALQYVHSYNVIHRDVKPHNILLRRGEAKLADFGNATMGPLARGRAGSTAYMAPEMVDEARSYTYLVDVWSLGCVVGAMVDPDGRSPFRGRQTAETLSRITSLTPARLPGDATVRELLGQLIVPETLRGELVCVEVWALETHHLIPPRPPATSGPPEPPSPPPSGSPTAGRPGRRSTPSLSSL